MGDINANDYMRTDLGRPMTVTGAVHQFVEKMEVGESKVVSCLVDVTGERKTRDRLSVMLGKVQDKTGMRFMTKDMKDGNLCHIWRIA